MKVSDIDIDDDYEGNDWDLPDEDVDDHGEYDRDLFSEVFDDYGEWGKDGDTYGEAAQQLAEMERIKHENEVRNIHRDKRGRLNKGALLASKYNCNKEDIQRMYDSGMTVQQIVKYKGCSKSTVYNVLKRHREKDS